FGSPKKVSAAVFCISIPAFLIVEAYGESSVSRRLVNLPYIALQIGLLAPPFALAIYHSFTIPVSPRNGRKDFIPFYAKIADHGTVYFLVANLITGGLNFSFDSLVRRLKKVGVAVFSTLMILIFVACGEDTISRRLVNPPYIALQVGLLAPPFAHSLPLSQNAYLEANSLLHSKLTTDSV
ncbi:unnamed protein product, partial [Rodentolepis nana]|uniref:Aa_trans domain-containing protein n=1 Tax=Rodentolepis nana TaxID=102285 RepID=A0A0R3T6W4_RODNA